MEALKPILHHLGGMSQNAHSEVPNGEDTGMDLSAISTRLSLTPRIYGGIAHCVGGHLRSLALHFLDDSPDDSEDGASLSMPVAEEGSRTSLYLEGWFLSFDDAPMQPDPMSDANDASDIAPTIDEC